MIAQLRWRGGARQEALALARAGLALARETGMHYLGPMLLGQVALV